MAAGGLDVAATIDVVEEALRLHAEGDTRLPSKSALLWSDELGSEEKDGRIMAMPAYVGGSVGLVGLKWIPSVPSNPSRGLPRGIGGLVDVVKSPMYATAVGLVMYGAKQQENSPYFKIREDNVYRKVKNRMKEWLGEIF